MNICPTYQSYNEVDQPSFEPLTVSEMAIHLRIDDVSDDAELNSYLQALITAARVQCENYTGMVICARNFIEKHSDLLGTMMLRWGNVQSITSIKYLDEDVAEQTLSDINDNYIIDLNNDPAIIQAKPDFTIPDTADVLNAVTIEYLAGYQTAEAIPEPIKHAIRLMVGKYYENREDDQGRLKIRALPTAAEALLNQYKVWAI